jgi:hypothetical protein
MDLEDTNASTLIIYPKNLSSSEKIRRLMMINETPATVYAGIEAARQMNYGTAEKYFDESGEMAEYLKESLAQFKTEQK